MKEFERKEFTIYLTFPKKFLCWEWNKKIEITFLQPSIHEVVKYMRKIESDKNIIHLII